MLGSAFAAPQGPVRATRIARTRHRSAGGGLCTAGPEPMHARVAKLADAPDLGSGGATHGGSNPPSRTSLLINEVSSRSAAALVLPVVTALHAPSAGRDAGPDIRIHESP